MNMVDRVAKAIVGAMLADETVWRDNFGDKLEELVLDGCVFPKEIAKAAIAAMREPIEPILVAGGNALLQQSAQIRSRESTSEIIWRAMIDEALKDA